jgi:hypothetical protein
VLYGAAEYSRDLDLVVLVDEIGLPRLAAAMSALRATVIAVPGFEAEFLWRGHAVHFNVPPEVGDAGGSSLRVDVMTRMRGVAPFQELWNQRTTIALSDESSGSDVLVDVLGLPDLVRAKKTQRDKDWPIIRRLVDASYAVERERAEGAEQIEFWLDELRSPEFLREAVARYPQAAAHSTRAAVIAVRTGGDVSDALAREQAEEMQADRLYWQPLRRELELLRHTRRREGAD